MKVDMSPEAIRKRFEQVRVLNRLCLSLASSSAGRDIIQRYSTNVRVQRTGDALGTLRQDVSSEDKP